MTTSLRVFSFLVTLVILVSLVSTMINTQTCFISSLMKVYDDDNSETNDTSASSVWQRKHTESPSSDQLKNIENKQMLNIETGSLSTPNNLRNNANSSEENEKPLFVLHIGPPKTGTTTLQCELGLKFQDLIQENFYYLGTYHAPHCGLPMDHQIDGFSELIRSVLLHCYASHANKGCDLDKQWQAFATILESYKEHNVIVSDEMFLHHFAQDDVLRLAKLLQQHWDVRILYTYRHFYSSLPSLYHEINDPYATQPGFPHAVEKTMWPEDGGYKIKSFRDGNYFFIKNEMTKFFYWVIAFGNVHVFDMHNGNDSDYLPSFLCTMIPETKSLCQPSPSSAAEASQHKQNDSASKYLRYDMLAVAAHEQGLLDHTNMSREMVRDAVQEYCEIKKWTSLDDFPLNCLSESETDSFLDESLRKASMLQPYFANHRESTAIGIEAEIRSGFQHFREKKKFCSVNAERALEEEHWRHFFRKLN